MRCRRIGAIRTFTDNVPYVGVPCRRSLFNAIIMMDRCPPRHCSRTNIDKAASAVYAGQKPFLIFGSSQLASER